jgi:hypothetical protein
MNKRVTTGTRWRVRKMSMRAAALLLIHGFFGCLRIKTAYDTQLTKGRFGLPTLSVCLLRHKSRAGAYQILLPLKTEMRNDHSASNQRFN